MPPARRARAGAPSTDQPATVAASARGEPVGLLRRGVVQVGGMRNELPRTAKQPASASAAGAAPLAADGSATPSMCGPRRSARAAPSPSPLGARRAWRSGRRASRRSAAAPTPRAARERRSPSAPAGSWFAGPYRSAAPRAGSRRGSRPAGRSPRSRRAGSSSAPAVAPRGAQGPRTDMRARTGRAATCSPPRPGSRGAGLDVERHRPRGLARVDHQLAAERPGALRPPRPDRSALRRSSARWGRSRARRARRAPRGSPRSTPDPARAPRSGPPRRSRGRGRARCRSRTGIPRRAPGSDRPARA